MYLKSLELCGFKSFADRTKLVFEPGLIAIVGPNGCGKSNVSDAIRWVLGEQRPTALRGSKMLDVVFNGTDSRKQMQMAEVSITFAGCEGTIDSEFDEITVTRRVFRTGEGAYYINKQPCRLKDIHRLFMGTGIGTTSYSVMAQGQIDAILSSRPEDRRTIFEEAAGITKFKADRKEALHKLELTEANLVRLSDVIREVKRQIGSLQRQVSKAKRYKELKAELRSYDIFAQKLRIAAMDARIAAIDAEIEQLNKREADCEAAIAESEKNTSAIRAAISENEEKINAATETATQNEGNLGHAKEIIRIGEQRIGEYRALEKRDTDEVQRLTEQLSQVGVKLDGLSIQRVSLEQAANLATRNREAAQKALDEERTAVSQMRSDLSKKRDVSMERERNISRLQNRISTMDAQRQASSAKRERLGGELDKLRSDLERLSAMRTALDAEIKDLRKGADEAARVVADGENALNALRTSLRGSDDAVAKANAQVAAVKARLDLLNQQERNAESFQEGSRKLLNPKNPLGVAAGTVLGPVAAKFNAKPEYRVALEAVLRAWSDAIAVDTDASVKSIFRKLGEGGKPSATRLASAQSHAAAAAVAVDGLLPLSSVVTISADFAATGASMLAGVFLADSLDAVPEQIPAGAVVVTKDGAVFRADGLSEFCPANGAAQSPLARRMAISDCEEQLKKAEEALAAARAASEASAEKVKSSVSEVNASRTRLYEARKTLGVKEGELSAAVRDVNRAEERIDVVSAEIKLSVDHDKKSDEEKDKAAAELEALVADRESFLSELTEQQNKLQERETAYNERNREYTDARILESNRTQELTQVTGQIELFKSRRDELQQTIASRQGNLKEYQENISRLNAQIEEACGNLSPLQERAKKSREELDAWKSLRVAKNRDLERAELALNAARQGVEAVKNRRNNVSIEKAEVNVRRQGRLDRILQNYSATPEQIASEPAPDWKGETELTVEQAEAKVAELNRSIESLGPVNLVAVEEYSELEERYALDKAQEDDLLKSKAQLTELIRQINEKSAELFRSTFEQANANFEKMFTKLFNGGTAKLVILDNPDDPLECGVEIIARPPGKRLQSISLLSGGERTMTAVALLFAIYEIKPSPFCLLDELDAALDDSNIGRFVGTLKDFLSQSQFLIITHNQHSIANSSIVYGVTMPEKGISKIVSMRLPDIGVKELEA